MSFQEANQQCSSTASPTSKSVPQTSNNLKNRKIMNQSSSQRNSDTDHSPYSDKLSKPKKYFNVDFNPDGSVNMPQRNQLSLENCESIKKTPQPCRATVHQLLQLAKQGHIQQAEKVFHVSSWLVAIYLC